MVRVPSLRLPTRPHGLSLPNWEVALRGGALTGDLPPSRCLPHLEAYEPVAEPSVDPEPTAAKAAAKPVAQPSQVVPMAPATPAKSTTVHPPATTLPSEAGAVSNTTVMEAEVQRGRRRRHTRRAQGNILEGQDLRERSVLLCDMTHSSSHATISLAD